MTSQTAILATILGVMTVLPSCSASSNKIGVVVPLGASMQDVREAQNTEA